VPSSSVSNGDSDFVIGFHSPVLLGSFSYCVFPSVCASARFHRAPSPLADRVNKMIPTYLSFGWEQLARFLRVRFLLCALPKNNIPVGLFICIKYSFHHMFLWRPLPVTHTPNCVRLHFRLCRRSRSPLPTAEPPPHHAG